MTTPLRLIIFDYDGTLVDSHGGFHEAFGAAFQAIGVEPPGFEETRSIVGFGVEGAVKRFVPDADEEMIQSFAGALQAARDFQRANGEPQDRLVEGTREMLSALGDADMLAAVATNKSRKGLDHSLKAHGLERHFVYTRTADDTHAKPHPAMIEEILGYTGVARGHAVMVGDTTVDMEMAASAGVPAIGVSWGYHAPEDLKAGGAQRVITGYADLGLALQTVWL